MLFQNASCKVFRGGMLESVQNPSSALLKLDNCVPQLVYISAGEFLYFLAVLHEHEGGHGVDVVLRRDVLTLVNVHLERNKLSVLIYCLLLLKYM